MASYCPDKGEVIWLDLDPQAGHEQAGRRPVFVLSPKAYNSKTGLAMVCPITNQTKNYAFEVFVPEGFKVNGVILSDHIKTLDWKIRKSSKICRLPVSTFENVKENIFSLIGD